MNDPQPAEVPATDPAAAPGTGKTASDRRGFLTGGLMISGLVSGYGALAAMAARFLYPAKPEPKAWLFVARADEMKDGDSIQYRTPTGQQVAVARQGSKGTIEDFIALSSTCPHLGCQVHWESPNQRFFCPCHNGAFGPSGAPIAGPPAEAGQSLPRFPLKIENDLLYIEVPVEGLKGTMALERNLQPAPPGPGHDPCLGASRGGDLA